MRESFIFYSSFGALIELLPSKKRLAIYEAIYHYGAHQKEADFSADPQQDAVWRSILPQLKANQKRYENGKKGAESGILGGAPVGNTNAKKTTPKTTPNPSENSEGKTTPKTTPNVNEYVNPYQDLQKSKGERGESARAREDTTALDAFIEKWGINASGMDNYSAGRAAGMDWEAISDRVEKSAFLRQQKSLAFYIRHGREIVEGYYDDFAKPVARGNAPPTDLQSVFTAEKLAEYDRLVGKHGGRS